MIHATAHVADSAQIGANTNIWHEAQVREDAVIGAECIVGKGVYIDRGVVIGDRVKIQNRASLYRGLTVEDGVFIGPHVSFSNDRYPRAISPDGKQMREDDWQVEPTLVLYGASIGAGAVIVPGVTIGRWAMVGAGATVTRNVPEQALVLGTPARHAGYVCTCGRPLAEAIGDWRCTACDRSFSFESGDSPNVAQP